MASAQRLLACAEGVAADSRLVALISGGGSAMATLPPDGLSLAEVAAATTAVRESGAPIAELNAVRKHRGEEELDAMDFLKLIKEKAAMVEMKQEFLYRSVNEGFSGGEKKRNEILQMALLEPRLSVLDETDSGLDIDALRIVAEGVNKLRSPDRAIVVVTHYQRLLDYIVPDHVHVLAGGRIIRSGGKELAQELERKGYGWIEDQAAA